MVEERLAAISSFHHFKETFEEESLTTQCNTTWPFSSLESRSFETRLSQQRRQDLISEDNGEVKELIYANIIRFPPLSLNINEIKKRNWL